MLPNFFLAGAPKAGTTSLHHYLSQHPQIYMSPLKEPCYFSAEFRVQNCAESMREDVERGQRELKRYLAGPVLEYRFGGMIDDWDDYLRLFADARGEIAIGEATPGYLWSKTAARHIYARIPDAKILCMLRDPAERAFSQYMHGLASGKVRRSFREHIEANLRNRSEKFSIDYPFLEMGMYYEQVRRFLALFPRENVWIGLYEDYRAAPERVFESIFRFLGVDAAFAPDTSRRHLEARVARRPGLTQALQRLGVWKAAKRLTPDRLLPMARRMAFAPRGRLSMSADERRFLVEYYADEIRKVAELIGRDLSAWTEPLGGVQGTTLRTLQGVRR